MKLCSWAFFDVRVLIFQLISFLVIGLFRFSMWSLLNLRKFSFSRNSFEIHFLCFFLNFFCITLSIFISAEALDLVTSFAAFILYLILLTWVFCWLDKSIIDFDGLFLLLCGLFKPALSNTFLFHFHLFFSVSWFIPSH